MSSPKRKTAGSRSISSMSAIRRAWTMERASAGRAGAAADPLPSGIDVLPPVIRGRVRALLGEAHRVLDPADSLLLHRRYLLGRGAEGGGEEGGEPCDRVPLLPL